MASAWSWRVAFALSGIFIVIGGANHPRGTMADMLAHPDWVWSHLTVLLGFIAFLVGLIVIERQFNRRPRTRRWVRYAVIGTALQVIEMVLHTASVVDAQNLVAGASTPVLTMHLVAAVLFYPVFGATTIAFVLATARERVIGSPGIAWLGVLGALAHGLSAPLVVGLQQGWAGILFPMIILLGLWSMLVALWPARLLVNQPAPA